MCTFGCILFILILWYIDQKDVHNLHNGTCSNKKSPHQNVMALGEEVGVVHQDVSIMKQCLKNHSQAAMYTVYLTHSCQNKDWQRLLTTSSRGNLMSYKLHVHSVIYVVQQVKVKTPT